MHDMMVGDAATHGMDQHRTGSAQLRAHPGGRTRDQRRGQGSSARPCSGLARLCRHLLHILSLRAVNSLCRFVLVKSSARSRRACADDVAAHFIAQADLTGCIAHG